MPQKGETIAIIHVKDYGDIKVRFFKDVAPKAVENFITHSKNGYYNGVIFHRVMNDFMIQGGDPTGTGYGGESIWKKSFEDEFSYDLVPYRGALCMANSGSNTNGSQFFIEQARYDEQTAKTLSQYGYPDNILAAYKIYGGSMHLFGKHTVFGQVIDGMDVVDKIAAVETDSNNKPTNPVVIESIEITEY
jgi:peptidyl-prolyl cis-trans isomerase B (cyclophilin B)